MPKTSYTQPTFLMDSTTSYYADVNSAGAVAVNVTNANISVDVDISDKVTVYQSVASDLKTEVTGSNLSATVTGSNLSATIADILTGGTQSNNLSVHNVRDLSSTTDSVSVAVQNSTISDVNTGGTQSNNLSVYNVRNLDSTLDDVSVAISNHPSVTVDGTVNATVTNVTLSDVSTGGTQTNNLSVYNVRNLDSTTDDVKVNVANHPSVTVDGTATVTGSNLSTKITDIMTGGTQTNNLSVHNVNLGQTEDDAHTSGDTGVVALAVRQDDAETLVGTDGDYSPLTTSDHGCLNVDPQHYYELDGCNATTGWSVLGDDTVSLATATDHVEGTTSLEFDKVNGSDDTVFAGIQKTITSVSAKKHLEEGSGFILASYYLSSVANVNYAFIRLGTDLSNYNEWRVQGEEMAAGWNNVRFPMTKPESAGSTGTGWDSTAVTYVTVGVAFDAETNTLADIRIDSLHMNSGLQTSADITAQISSSVSSPNVIVRAWGNAVDTDAGNSSNNTLRTVLATDQSAVSVTSSTVSNTVIDILTGGTQTNNLSVHNVRDLASGSDNVSVSVDNHPSVTVSSAPNLSSTTDSVDVAISNHPSVTVSTQPNLASTTDNVKVNVANHPSVTVDGTVGVGASTGAQATALNVSATTFDIRAVDSTSDTINASIGNHPSVTVDGAVDVSAPTGVQGTAMNVSATAFAIRTLDSTSDDVKVSIANHPSVTVDGTVTASVENVTISDVSTGGSQTNNLSVHNVRNLSSTLDNVAVAVTNVTVSAQPNLDSTSDDVKVYVANHPSVTVDGTVSVTVDNVTISDVNTGGSQTNNLSVHNVRDLASGSDNVKVSVANHPSVTVDGSVDMTASTGAQATALNVSATTFDIRAIDSSSDTISVSVDNRPIVGLSVPVGAQATALNVSATTFDIRAIDSTSDDIKVNVANHPSVTIDGSTAITVPVGAQATALNISGAVDTTVPVGVQGTAQNVSATAFAIRALDSTSDTCNVSIGNHPSVTVSTLPAITSAANSMKVAGVTGVQATALNVSATAFAIRGISSTSDTIKTSIANHPSVTVSTAPNLASGSDNVSVSVDNRPTVDVNVPVGAQATALNVSGAVDIAVPVGAQATALNVSGSVTATSTVSGTTSTYPGRYDSTIPTAGFDGQGVQLLTDAYGALQVTGHAGNAFKANGSYSSAQTNTSLSAAPGASLSLYLTDIIVSNGATGGQIRLVEDTGGTPVTVVPTVHLSSNCGVVSNFKTPLKLTANKNLGITSTTVTSHSVLVVGYTAP